jgi:hypothetical protein
MVIPRLSYLESAVCRAAIASAFSDGWVLGEQEVDSDLVGKGNIVTIIFYIDAKLERSLLSVT